MIYEVVKIKIVSIYSNVIYILYTIEYVYLYNKPFKIILPIGFSLF